MVQLNLQNKKGMKRLNQMEKKNKEKEEKNKEKKEKKEKVKRERLEMNVVLVVMKLNSKNLEWINLHKIEKGNLLFSKKKLFILFGERGRGNKPKNKE